MARPDFSRVGVQAALAVGIDPCQRDLAGRLALALALDTLLMVTPRQQDKVDALAVLAAWSPDQGTKQNAYAKLASLARRHS